MSEKEKEGWTKKASKEGRKRQWLTDTDRTHTSVFMAGFSSPIHPCLIFFTSHLPFSAANVSYTAGGNYTSAHRGDGQSITCTRLQVCVCMLTHRPTKLKQKQAFLNCYMGESDVSFSFYHIVMCIIITLGHKFNALLMAFKEKKKNKVPVKPLLLTPWKF